MSIDREFVTCMTPVQVGSMTRCRWVEALSGATRRRLTGLTLLQQRAQGLLIEATIEERSPRWVRAHEQMRRFPMLRSELVRTLRNAAHS
jgi:hypothetical protein